MALLGIWPLSLAALGATTAVLWWRTRSQHGPSTYGQPSSTRPLHVAVVPVQRVHNRACGTRGQYIGSGDKE
jgi:hypothetical protein